MRKLVMAINLSLDGYADHTVAVGDDELHAFFTNLLNDTGIELFGRITYEMMASYWPHAHEEPGVSELTLKFAERFNSMDKVVFSKTLEKAEWTNTTLVKSDAIEYVTKLKQTEGKNIAIGGITLAGSLMQAGLIDEYWIVVHPVIVGKGRRFFANVNEQTNLKLIESKKLKSGAVALHYEVIKGS